MTPFGRILEGVVRATPGAIGGAFAARDGEMVDAFVPGDPYEWAILTAHFGVIAALLESAFGTLHFGGCRAFFARYAKADVVTCAVDAGYFALIAIARPADAAADYDPCADALARLGDAVGDLVREMG